MSRTITYDDQVVDSKITYDSALPINHRTAGWIGVHDEAIKLQRSVGLNRAQFTIKAGRRFTIKFTTDGPRTWEQEVNLTDNSLPVSEQLSQTGAWLFQELAQVGIYRDILLTFTQQHFVTDIDIKLS